MALAFYDRVQETTTTTGTGALTLAGALTGFQSWAAVGDGNQGYYGIEAVDATGAPTGEWEVGLGTYASAGPTLTRTRVLASSNSGSAVNFAVGTKRVMLVDAAFGMTSMPILTADPASPIDDTCWAVREGTSPTQTVSIKVRISGVTVTLAAVTR